MNKLMRRRLTSWLAIALIAVSSLAFVMVSRATVSAGCEGVVGPITESKQFTPFEGRRGWVDPAINPEGTPGQDVPASIRLSSIDDKALAWATGNATGSVYQYFLQSELDPTMTVSEFYKAGGIQLDRDPIEGNEPFASTLPALVGDRAVGVEIGEHKGVVVWADPLANGVRTHHLYWSDDGFNYALIADVSAEDIVGLGRELVCAGALSD